ncbi:ABC transporter ATP-binding protein [Holzapfeliella sp. He02]|uniref:ABC transporter ATP-binding protein n=1 Tax=Holzapfeliella saturejae TaxID=3082953 RepID=A0ABU8SER7_9LACO
MARALLKKSNVLILDEATSGLDALIEKEITDYLLSLNQKTIIFISHHLPVAKKCDQVLVLDKGKLVEQGSHSELIKQEHLYHQLYNI